MSQTYQSRRRMGTAPVQGNAPAQAFAPAQAAASMIGNQSMEALMTGTQANAMENGASRLDEVMQQRVREHFLGNQIPQAEQEADRLAAQVKDAHTPEEVKSQLGDQLGADFSGVRFHTGAQAEQMADGIGARAYTAGNDVYFGQGGFDPAVAAHELVHTAQQGVVDSSVSTVAAPMGGVQMMPKFLSAIGNGFKRAGRWFKGLFRSKEDKNLDKLGAASVPSRAGEQEAHLPFTQAQINNMENTSSGVRSDGTIEERIAPVTAPMKQEMGDYFSSLDNTGFDYEMAGADTQEYRQNAVGVKYNKSTIAATKKLMEMFSSHVDQPEMQAMLRDVYGHEMQNPEKMGTMPHSHADMESRFIKNIMSKGLLPVGSQIRNAIQEGNDTKVDFLRKLQTNTAYLETMHGKMGNEDFPEELQELMAAYGPLREKLLAAGRG